MALFLSLTLSGSTLASSAAPLDRFMSWAERRDEGVIKQQLDYSCGIASLATLLHLQQIASPTERQLIERLAGLVDQTPVARVDTRLASGYSLADLSGLAASYGVSSFALRLTAAQLRSLKIPVIVQLHLDTGSHFSVLIKAQRDTESTFRLADSSWGNRRMLPHQFLDLWLDPAIVADPKNEPFRRSPINRETATGSPKAAIAQAETGLVFALIPRSTK